VDFWLHTISDTLNDFSGSLQELVADVSANISVRQPINLQMQGIVALSGWLSLDDVVLLNEHPSVFLADASPSYVRLVTQELMSDQAADSEVLLPDGVSPLIHHNVDDLFIERELIVQGLADRFVPSPAPPSVVLPEQ
jgi:hypothetical protein